MTKLPALLCLVLTGTPILAGEKCFCTPSTYQNTYTEPYYDYDDETTTINVVNRQLSIAPAKGAYKKDLATEKALKDQWAMLTSAIPISPAPQPLRQFQFNKNWPVTPAARQVQSRNTQTFQTQTTTQVLQGVVRQNLVIQGGVVTIDAPPAVIQQLVRP